MDVVCRAKFFRRRRQLLQVAAVAHSLARSVSAVCYNGSKVRMATAGAAVDVVVVEWRPFSSALLCFACFGCLHACCVARRSALEGAKLSRSEGPFALRTVGSINELKEGEAEEEEWNWRRRRWSRVSLVRVESF